MATDRPSASAIPSEAIDSSRRATIEGLASQAASQLGVDVSDVRRALDELAAAAPQLRDNELIAPQQLPTREEVLSGLHERESDLYMDPKAGIISDEMPQSAEPPLSGYDPYWDAPPKLSTRDDDPVAAYLEALAADLETPEQRAEAIAIGRVALKSIQLANDKRELDEFVAQARSQGATWSEIGRAVGVTAQTAHRRWDETGRTRHRDYQRNRYRATNQNETET